MTEFERGWVVGALEFAGSIRARCGYASIRARKRNRQPLETLAGLLGGTVYREGRDHVWECKCKTARAALAFILDYASQARADEIRAVLATPVRAKGRPKTLRSREF